MMNTDQSCCSCVKKETEKKVSRKNTANTKRGLQMNSSGRFPRLFLGCINTHILQVNTNCSDNLKLYNIVPISFEAVLHVLFFRKIVKYCRNSCKERDISMLFGFCKKCAQM